MQIVLDAETSEVVRAADVLRLNTTQGAFTAAHVVLGTGFRFDLSAEPALDGIADQVLIWRDLESSPDDVSSVDVEDEYLECPALGPGFEFRSKHGQDTSGLNRIRCFTHAAQPSLGNLANDIPQASEGAERLARAVARALFVEDAPFHRAALEAYDDPELLGDEFEV